MFLYTTHNRGTFEAPFSFAPPFIPTTNKQTHACFRVSLSRSYYVLSLASRSHFGYTQREVHGRRRHLLSFPSIRNQIGCCCFCCPLVAQVVVIVVAWSMVLGVLSPVGFSFGFLSIPGKASCDRDEEGEDKVIDFAARTHSHMQSNGPPGWSLLQRETQQRTYRGMPNEGHTLLLLLADRSHHMLRRRPGIPRTKETQTTTKPQCVLRTKVGKAIRPVCVRATT